MVSNIQVASKLLSSTGNGLCREASQDRDKGKKVSRARPAYKTAKTQTATQESECGAKGEKGDGQASRGEEHRAISALRKYVESVGRGDGHLRGSACELGIVYPTPTCTTSTTGAHWYVEIARCIYRCKFCWTPLWQPHDIYDAKGFGNEVHNFGRQAAYQNRVNKHKRILEVLAMLNALKVVKDSNQIDIALTVAAIVNKYKLAASVEVDEPSISTKGTKWLGKNSEPKPRKREHAHSRVVKDSNQRAVLQNSEFAPGR